MALIANTSAFLNRLDYTNLNTLEQALIDRLITAFTKEIEAQCNRVFAAANYTEKHDGDGETPTEGRVKCNVYFPPDVAEEILEECERLNRSPTWVMREVWRIAGPVMQGWVDPRGNPPPAPKEKKDPVDQ